MEYRPSRGPARQKLIPNPLGLPQEALGTLGDVSPGLGSQFITDHIRRFSPLPQDRDGLGAMLIDDPASTLLDQLFVSPVLTHARPTGVRMTRSCALAANPRNELIRGTWHNGRLVSLISRRANSLFE